MFLFECRKARVVPFDPALGLVPDDTFELSVRAAHADKFPHPF